MAPSLASCVVVAMASLLMAHCSSAEEPSRPPKLLVISMDGFRYDYLRVAHRFGYATPNFERLIAEGVSIKDPGLKNVFVSKTVPNHYTLATGLYPESHGVVGNSFYDPLYNESFAWIVGESSRDIKWWNGTGELTVEPVWVTNEAAGAGRASGVFLWPGSDVDGQRPRYFEPAFVNSSSIPFKTRIDAVIDWFTRSTDPICFGALFFQEPDKAGHRNGPETIQVARAIAGVDEGLGHLFARLESTQLLSELNVIVTSDHGMLQVDDSNTIYLDEYVDPELYESYVGSPTMHIVPKKGYEEEVYNKLSACKNLTVYKREDIPAEFHYSNNRRIPPIILLAPVGYQICRTNASCSKARGNHGWDSSLSEMHPIFFARGPAFKKNYTADPFETINVYALLCHLLDIKPRPNNGSVDAVRHILDDNWRCTVCPSSALSSFTAAGSIWIIVASVVLAQHLGRQSSSSS